MRSGLLLPPLLLLSQAATSFELPSGFEGLWSGVPTSSAIGPWSNNLTLGITRADNLDYLLGQDVTYDAQDIAGQVIGYQRFYLESTGPGAGNLWYCGDFIQWAHRPEQAGSGYPDKFIAQLTSPTDRAVTFCYDSAGHENIPGPFPWHSAPNCTGCGCANFTLSLLDDQRLSSTMITAGSTHIAVELQKIGAAPPVNQSAMPKHGGTFCDFDGVDSTPNNFTVPSSCPMMRAIRSLSPPAVPAPSEYDHCFVLNRLTGFRLEWTLEGDKLRVQVSSLQQEAGYIAIGFRPKSRARDLNMNQFETGSDQLFGMKGADIVVGTVSNATTMYASNFHGAPTHADYLHVTDANTAVSSGRQYLSFTRGLIGGKLHAVWGRNDSVVSPEADIIWAVGGLDGGSIGYHGVNRGLRLVDWVDPSPMEHLKCA